MEHIIKLVHHSANREHGFPSGSLAAVRNCIENKASYIEVDICPTVDGRWALLHNPTLEGQVTGKGRVDAHTAAELAGMKLITNGQPTAEPVSFLSDLLILMETTPYPLELQLDLKAHSPLPLPLLEGLVQACEPLLGRIRISSVADWVLRRLARIEPQLALGFDPLAYLDVGNGQERKSPPRRVGAYGYHDEHPLAETVWGTPAEYLATRAEILYDQAPAGAVWYIRAYMLDQALRNGFDWITFLHNRDAEVDAWTLDNTRSLDTALIPQLAQANVDRITSNTAPAIAALLQESCCVQL